MKPLYVDLEYREHLGEWLNQHDLLGVGVEVGCAFGGFAKVIMEKWKGRELWMVDPWILQSPAVYKEKINHIDYELCYRQCAELAKNDPRIHLVRKLSTEAAPQFNEGSLDFVFIDGNHSYEAVKADLEAWYPKVKPGGVFSGHDYGNDINWPNYCQVKKAVDEWAALHRVPFTYSRCNSWWVLKPETT